MTFLNADQERFVERVSGIITVVQEGRFRLASDDGRSLLFTLAHGAPVEPQDLPALAGNRRVEIEYSRPQGLKALTAHDLRTDGRR
jgi:hypothetical protein